MSSKAVIKAGFKCPTFSAPSKKNVNTQESLSHTESKEAVTEVEETAVTSEPEKKNETSAASKTEKVDTNSQDLGNDEETSKDIDDKPSEVKLPTPVCAKPKKKKFNLVQKSAEDSSKSQTDQIEPSKPKKSKKTDTTSSSKGRPENNEKQAAKKEKKDAKNKENLPKKEKKEKAPKQPPLPMRSLTDEEYDEIFTAALERALEIQKEIHQSGILNKGNTSKETNDSSPSSDKVDAPVDADIGQSSTDVDIGKSSTDVDIGKSSTDVDIGNSSTDVDIGKGPVDFDIGKSPTCGGEVDEEGDCGEEEDVDEVEKSGELEDDENSSQTSNDVDKTNNENNTEEVEKANENDTQEDLPIVEEREDAPQQDILGEPSEIQRMNETTPDGSELEFGSQVKTVEPNPKPKKKKKKINKKQKLDPKQLPFSDQHASSEEKNTECKSEKEKTLEKIDSAKEPLPADKKLNTQISEKIQKLKEIRKEHFDVPKKKKKKKKTIREDRDVKEVKKLPKSAEKTQRPKETLSSETSQPRLNKRKKMLHRDIENNGTWVLCCNSSCNKWRHLTDVADPSDVPQRWVCSMNTNKAYNSCDKTEESYDETDHIYTQFTEGSVVWAKMTGFPWWPALVEIDPDVEAYFEAQSSNYMSPTHYHVVFFDERVSRAWVRSSNVKLFSGSEQADGITTWKPKKGTQYKREIVAAKHKAKEAMDHSLKERIDMYSFAVRFRGKWGNRTEATAAVSKKDKKLKIKNWARGIKRKSVKDVEDSDSSDELLDDPTMNEMLSHTEEILHNVEEVLDSLDSQALEDEDTDEEEVLKKTKRKRKATEVTSESETEDNSQKIECRQRKSGRAIKIVRTDSEDESQNDSVKNNDTSGKGTNLKETMLVPEPVIEDTKDCNMEAGDDCDDDEEEEGEDKESVTPVVAPLKFDSEIFTMEIEEDDKLTTENVKQQSKLDKKKAGFCAPAKNTKVSKKENKGKAKEVTSKLVSPELKGQELSQSDDVSVNLSREVGSQDSVVPDICDSILDSEQVRSQKVNDSDQQLELSVEENSIPDFDLDEDLTMYNQDAAIKVPDNVIPVPQQLPQLDLGEDSDPFDMIEE